MSATLEAMARAIFKSWFVNFDAVRAIAEGRDAGLPSNIAALFPDAFEESQLGEIPKGWSVASLGELASLEYGKPLKAESRQRGSVPVYGSNGVVGWHNDAMVQGRSEGKPGCGNLGTDGFFSYRYYFLCRCERRVKPAVSVLCVGNS